MNKVKPVLNDPKKLTTSNDKIPKNSTNTIKKTSNLVITTQNNELNTSRKLSSALSPGASIILSNNSTKNVDANKLNKNRYNNSYTNIMKTKSSATVNKSKDNSLNISKRTNVENDPIKRGSVSNLNQTSKRGSVSNMTEAIKNKIATDKYEKNANSLTPKPPISSKTTSNILKKVKALTNSRNKSILSDTNNEISIVSDDNKSNFISPTNRDKPKGINFDNNVTPTNKTNNSANKILPRGSISNSYSNLNQRPSISNNTPKNSINLKNNNKISSQQNLLNKNNTNLCKTIKKYPESGLIILEDINFKKKEEKIPELNTQKSFGNNSVISDNNPIDNINNNLNSGNFTKEIPINDIIKTDENSAPIKLEDLNEISDEKGQDKNKEIKILYSPNKNTDNKENLEIMNSFSPCDPKNLILDNAKYEIDSRSNSDRNVLPLNSKESDNNINDNKSEIKDSYNEGVENFNNEIDNFTENSENSIILENNENILEKNNPYNTPIKDKAIKILSKEPLTAIEEIDEKNFLQTPESHRKTIKNISKEKNILTDNHNELINIEENDIQKNLRSEDNSKLQENLNNSENKDNILEQQNFSSKGFDDVENLKKIKNIENLTNNISPIKNFDILYNRNIEKEKDKIDLNEKIKKPFEKVINLF